MGSQFSFGLGLGWVPKAKNYLGLGWVPNAKNCLGTQILGWVLGNKSKTLFPNENINIDHYILLDSIFYNDIAFYAQKSRLSNITLQSTAYSL